MSEPPLHIVLYQPEIPYNTGSVGRTCVATGCKLWLVRPLGFRLDDYYLRRAGLDYWQYVDYEVVDDWDQLTDKLPGGKKWFFTKKAQRYYHQVTYQPRDVMVFGCESTGLPDALLAGRQERLLRIPVREKMRSLNLSNAVSVAVYEAFRQLDLNPDQLDDG